MFCRSSTPRWTKEATVTRILLPDGRNLSYLIRGNPSRKNAIVWLHGIVSSRFEVLAAKEKLLEALDAYVIGIDRPGYGASDPLAPRSYHHFVKVRQPAFTCRDICLRMMADAAELT